MRRSIQFAISVVAVAVILAGARYAIARESLRDTNLHEIYERINQESFDGKLPNVPVTWDDLAKQDALGITDFDESGKAFSIELDRKEITDADDLRRVLRHEACHVFTGHLDDAHGVAWQDCMEGF